MSGLRVFVVAGGPSSEAEVSRASARGVCDALVRAGHSPVRLELDGGLAMRLQQEPGDVVFPVAHGALGEDGCLQGLLEICGIPYVGSGVLASALAADKPAAKAQFRAAGLPVAPELVVGRGSALQERASAARRALGRAVVVKPAGGGSAIGVTRIAAEEPDTAVVAALERVFALEPVALVEPLLVGRELTCAVLELDEAGPRALPSTEILSKAGDFYDFVSKYAPGGSEHRCPAPLEPLVSDRVAQIAVGAFRALGARDLGRADLILDADGGLTLLELNTLPGMTPTSLFPEAAAVAGIAFPELCDRLVRRAFERPRWVPAAAPALPLAVALP